MKWRNIHTDVGEWQYKIHPSQAVEIRSPSNMKFMTEVSKLNRSEEFAENFDLVEEGCYDCNMSLDEYSIYEERESGKRFRTCDKPFMNEWFGVKPSQIKKYIEERIVDRLPKSILERKWEHR